MAVQRLHVVNEAPADGQAPLDVTIDGLPAGFSKCAAVPDVSGEDATAAINTINALLASLRAGGVINAS